MALLQMRKLFKDLGKDGETVFTLYTSVNLDNGTENQETAGISVKHYTI